MPARPLRFGIKMAQMGGSYAEMLEAWLEADRLGFDTGAAWPQLGFGPESLAKILAKRI